MILALAGWFAAVIPCAALAQCVSPVPARSCCCKAGASCCCRGGEHSVPAPAPALPSPRVAPDHAAELPAAGNGLVTATLTDQLAFGVMMPTQFAPPAYLSACSFRC
jgi:hypothetical protein